MSLTCRECTHSVSRSRYFRLCIQASLRKRLLWVVLIGVLGSVVGYAVLGPRSGLVIGVAVLICSVVWIAAGSYLRHRDDYLPTRSEEWPRGI